LKLLKLPQNGGLTLTHAATGQKPGTYQRKPDPVSCYFRITGVLGRVDGSRRTIPEAVASEWRSIKVLVLRPMQTRAGTCIFRHSHLYRKKHACIGAI